jgi:hypothetical protein
VTGVVLAPGWRLWVESGTCLLCPGERLDDFLDDYALEEMVRTGRAVRLQGAEEVAA